MLKQFEYKDRFISTRADINMEMFTNAFNNYNQKLCNTTVKGTNNLSFKLITEKNCVIN